MKKLNCLVYCNCGAGIITSHKQKNITDSLKQLKVDVLELHDFCGFSLNEKKFLNALDKEYNKIFIVACYPRAIKNIIVQNEIKISNYEVLNFRELSEEQIVALLTEKMTDNPLEKKYEIHKSNIDVPAWYPVIDKSFCTLCGQCARFCVFGVYKYNKKSLKVVNPLSCKNNCPACGRTCPASAIIFPRLPENSVLSGKEPGDEKKPLKSDSKEGLFTLLNERNSVRRNIFKQGVILQADTEKQKAIEEFKKAQKK